MTTHKPAGPHVAASPVANDEIAADLPSLMERLERVRKHLLAEREYIKLVLVGGVFVLVGVVTSHTFPWPAYLAAAFLLLPLLFGWYNLPRLRLANAFRNETMPFLLRDYGRWNYALEGPHFSRDSLIKTGLLKAGHSMNISSIITGERCGVPLQFAVLSVWPAAKFGLFHGTRDVFSGWVANIRIPGLAHDTVQILPSGLRPDISQGGQWDAHPFSPTHQIWLLQGSSNSLPVALQNRLLQVILKAQDCRFALSAGVLWLLVPSDINRFNHAASMSVSLNEGAPYFKARKELAEMFDLVDVMVWPDR